MAGRKGRNRDSSGHWKWSVFYHNPEDPKLWVEKLYGWGWTLNTARPAAWLILVAMLFTILAMIRQTT
ncbi:MAG: DUF5808 domain-containing protein [Gammaproteobacteria bacterium]|nr:DUF5808 domain-containing protein [Gammaproteobacteria bacterium]MDE0270391.1 DUF5808 domain-containing protein [Gammaproteobacteria bacterium]